MFVFMYICTVVPNNILFYAPLHRCYITARLSDYRPQRKPAFDLTFFLSVKTFSYSLVYAFKCRRQEKVESIILPKKANQIVMSSKIRNHAYNEDQTSEFLVSLR